MSEDQPEKPTFKQIIEKRWEGAKQDPSIAQVAANPKGLQPSEPTELRPTKKSPSPSQ